MKIIFSHATGFPNRRVYKVQGTDEQTQKEAAEFIRKFQAVPIVDTRKKIKVILL